MADLARGAHADAIEHSLAAAAVANRARENLGIVALASLYAGDPDEARRLNDRALTLVTSPTMRSWAAYVAGEIDTFTGRDTEAERHYERAIELARTSGATFLVGVATVGLLAARARADRIHDALSGYRTVIDYFADTGNWTHQWVTLRNLADLLDRLGDHEPADRLRAAADQAPDAPAVAPSDRAPETRGAGPGRAAVIDLARQAIQRHHLNNS